MSLIRLWKAKNSQLRVRAEISSQIFRVEAPGWQGAKVQEYLAYSELSQRSQPGCIGAKNVKLFLREPLVQIDRMIRAFTDSAFRFQANL